MTTMYHQTLISRKQFQDSSQSAEKAIIAAGSGSPYLYTPSTANATKLMTNKISQSHPDKGEREFELVDDTINYRMSGPMGDEELTVVLSALSPEPVVDRDGAMLYFVSGINREPLIKLFVDLPDAKSFAEFVSTLQRRIVEEDFGKLAADNRQSAITRDQIDTTIHMLETNLDTTSISELLNTLRDLARAPEDREQLNKVVDAFHKLGMEQGQVLTYAPFFNSLLSSTDMNELS